MSGNPTTGNPTTEKPMTENPTEHKKDKKKTRKKPPISPEGEWRFTVFWTAYPRKDAKAKAKAAWAKLEELEMDSALFQRIDEALAAQKKCEQWQREGGRYIPMAATWLNQRRWEDEILEPAKQTEPEGGYGWR